MVGITLSAEQIQAAPSEVRQWLEHEIAHTLGFGPAAQPASPEAPHLAACSPQEAMAVYESIRSMLPVVTVFFELGRLGTRISDQGFVAIRLPEMLRNTRLPDSSRLVACLEVIDRAFRLARNDDHAVLSIIDPRGYCIVAEETQQGILAVWAREIAAQKFSPDGALMPEAGEFSRPFSTNGAVPPQSIHLGQALAGSSEPQGS